MIRRTCFLVLATVILSTCASERWPGQSDNDGWPSSSDYPIVQTRFEAASKKTLGTEQDVAEIKRAILKVHPEMNIDEIRWISATEVIAYTDSGRNLPLGYESFFCPLIKNDKKWQFIACYSYLIS